MNDMSLVLSFYRVYNRVGSSRWIHMYTSSADCVVIPFLLFLKRRFDIKGL